MPNRPDAARIDFEICGLLKCRLQNWKIYTLSRLKSVEAGMAKTGAIYH
jgi:hypothetical protein